MIIAFKPDAVGARNIFTCFEGSGMMVKFNRVKGVPGENEGGKGVSA